MIDKVNTPPWQNASYPASLHENVARQMKLWMQFGCVNPKMARLLDEFDFSLAPMLHCVLLQGLSASHNTTERSLCAYGCMILGSPIPKVALTTDHNFQVFPELPGYCFSGQISHWSRRSCQRQHWCTSEASRCFAGSHHFPFSVLIMDHCCVYSVVSKSASLSVVAEDSRALQWHTCASQGWLSCQIADFKSSSSHWLSLSLGRTNYCYQSEVATKKKCTHPTKVIWEVTYHHLSD